VDGNVECTILFFAESKMFRRLVTGAGLVLVVAASAIRAQVATQPAPLTIESLEAKLAKAWDSKRWSDESVALMKAVWADFKENQKADGGGSTSKVGNVGTPNPADIESYLGAFGAKEGAGAALLEVSKNAGGFAVKVQGQTVPAVVWNKSILFTTGDVVESSTPSFGGKRHGAMEMFLVTSVNGKFYFLSLGNAGQATELVKK